MNIYEILTVESRIHKIRRNCWFSTCSFDRNSEGLINVLTPADLRGTDWEFYIPKEAQDYQQVRESHIDEKLAELENRTRVLGDRLGIIFV